MQDNTTDKQIIFRCINNSSTIGTPNCRREYRQTEYLRIIWRVIALRGLLKFQNTSRLSSQQESLCGLPPTYKVSRKQKVSKSFKKPQGQYLRKNYNTNYTIRKTDKYIKNSVPIHLVSWTRILIVKLDEKLQQISCGHMFRCKAVDDITRWNINNRG